MANTYGALPLVIPAPAAGEAAGDPGLTVIAHYLKAVINARATTAWRAPGVAPAGDTVQEGRDYPVNGVFTHDPGDEFSEKSLPAIYVFRSQTGPFEDMATDYRVARSTITVWWVVANTLQHKRAARAPFENAIAKIIDDALDRLRDPAYVLDGDADPLAAAIDADADAIKLSVATSTSQQTYSGAALNGVIGGSAMDPPRSPTVTATGSAGNFVVGSTVTWNGVNAIGQDVSVSATITGAGSFDAEYELVEIDSIVVAAQAATGGALQFGTAARAGLGSDLCDAAGLQDIRATRAAPKVITIAVSKGEPRSYDALEILIEVEERRVEDVSQFPLIDEDEGSADVSFNLSDGSEFSDANYH